MNKKLLTVLALMLSIFSFNAIAQEILPDVSEDVVKKIYDKEEQKNFVVIESVTTHEFNPHKTAISNDNDILVNVYEGLFTANPVSLDPQFAIAVDYKISRDKKRWQITIRDDAKFSNGEKITAEDVRYSWLTLLETENAPYASLLDIIRGAKEYREGKGSKEDVGIYAIEDNKLNIYLNSPTNYLPNILCHPSFAIINKDPTVFSGAYTISEVTENKTVLTKNPNYWDAKNVIIENVTFLQSNNMEENTAMFNNGDAQWVTGFIVPDKILDKDAIQVSAQYGISFFFFKDSKSNPKKKESGSVWDLKEFRLALLEATPWEQIRSGESVPATTFVYQLNGYPTVSGYDFTDPLEAKFKMTEAREKYNVPEDEILPLVFEITKGSISEQDKQAFIDAYGPLGVEVSFRELPSALYFDHVRKSDADVFLYSWIGDFSDPLTFLELFHGGSTMNESGWQNDEYDRLIEEAAQVSSADRYKLLAEAETLLLDEGMILPISHPISLNTIDPKEIGGWYPNAFDVHLFKYMYIKKETFNIPNLVRYNY